MKDRFKSAVIIIVLFSLLAAFSRFTIILRLMTALLSFAALAEIFYVSGWVKKVPVMILAGISCLLIPFLPPLTGREAWMRVFVVAVYVVAVFVARRYQFALSGMLTVASILIFVPLCFSTIVMLRAGNAGLEWFYAVFVCAWGSDAGGYFIGHLFGRRKLAPRISPNKTVEGLFGCFVTAIAGMLIVGFFTKELTPYHVNFVSLTVSAIIGTAAGVFGDLSASAIKRYFGVKDFGKILPGHGGIMDRFDSVLFCAPALYLYHVITSFLFAECGLDWMVFRL